MAFGTKGKGGKLRRSQQQIALFKRK